ncbi:MAG: alginate lyase family protein [Pseudomonadota bacterium]
MSTVATGAARAERSAVCLPPAPVQNITLQRYYSDRNGTQVDAARLTAYRAETAALTSFLREVSRFADRSWQASTVGARETAAHCGLRWLVTWADGGAYLGQMSSKQAEYQRKWDLAGLSLAYLKLRRHANASTHAVVIRWLGEIADRAERFQMAPGRKPNNHLYWLALGMSAQALAADDDLRWRRARELVRFAARQIADDGTLPLELARGRRALHYHTFSAMPLIAAAELAHSRGEDWYAFAGGALHRLVAVTVAGLVEPPLFDRIASVQQVRPVTPRAGWLFLYARRHPRRGIPPTFQKKRRHRLLGGDVRVLLAAIK